MLPLSMQCRTCVYWPMIGMLMLGGCQWFVDDADREVYRLIESRQRAALGETRTVRIDQERPPIAVGAGSYAFVPHPIDSQVPASFALTTTRPARTEEMPAGVDSREPAATSPADSPGRTRLAMPAAERPPGATEPIVATRPSTATRPAPAVALASTSTTQPAAALPSRPVLTLAGALSYAFRNSRDFQSAKEDLYMEALGLSLERHLWTPRLMGEIESQYANYGQIREFDHAMAAVATVGIEQQLPYGGEVTAQIISTLMRDLTHHVTTSETGAMILQASIPLLRGAGPVAYESRYQAERSLIYAVRVFERFRRRLAVQIAGSYFNLQQLRQRILNAHESVGAFTSDVQRAEARWRTGRVIRLDVLRADEDRLRAANTEVNAIERYETALDVFKIQIGMPTETAIDVEFPADLTAESATKAGPLYADALEQALRMPDVSEKQAISAALRHRLDLLNVLDQTDDAHRGVKIAENNLLPDLVASGSVQMDTDASELGSLKYNSERTTWRGFLTLELPLDRKAERNALRESLIGLRRAERNHDQARDQVRLEVRRAMRRAAQRQESLEILRRSRDQARIRRRAAQIRFELGQLNNRDVVEAQRELLDAQDSLAQAQAEYRLAILEFRLDTGTLRIDDDGRWAAPVATAAETR